MNPMGSLAEAQLWDLCLSLNEHAQFGSAYGSKAKPKLYIWITKFYCILDVVLYVYLGFVQLALYGVPLFRGVFSQHNVNNSAQEPDSAPEVCK